MPLFSHVATLADGDFVSDDLIADLDIGWLGGAPFLFAGSGADGGLTSFAVAVGTAAVQSDAVAGSSLTGTTALADLDFAALGGQPMLLTAGRWDDAIAFRAVATGGAFGAIDVPTTGGTSTARPTAIEAFTAGGESLVALTGQFGTGLTLFSVSPTQDLTPLQSLPHTPLAALDRIADMTALNGASGDWLAVASPSENQVTLFSADGSSLTGTGHFNSVKGEGVQGLHRLAGVSLDGQEYLLAGAGTSGTLSVLRVNADGSLTETDRATDDANSRFSGVTAIATVEHQGHTYAFAGGTDAGLTMFELLPRGLLLPLGTVADSFTTTLSSVSAIEAVSVGGELQLFVSALNEPGITQFIVDPATPGIVSALSGTTGGTLAGTAADDVLAGGDGRDVLTGAAGADVLVDGAGTDTLSGGSGADVFVFVRDGTADRITDFEPGIDRIDLSAHDFLYSVAGLDIESTSYGARIVVGDEVLRVESMSGAALTEVDFCNDSFLF